MRQLLMLALILSIASEYAHASEMPFRTRMGWENRLTWGIAPLVESGTGVPGSGQWLASQLGRGQDHLPPQVAAQIAAMRITKTPMQQIVIDMDAEHHAYTLIEDAEAAKAARATYRSHMNMLANEARSRFLLRAIYGSDQLREQMTWFWFNHFNVDAAKRDISAMVGDYEENLRAGALGKFRDLLEVSLRHPAMLRYLENDKNAKGRINENYAREIMELHTLGVDGGYGQKDVQELARILTGVGISLKEGMPQVEPSRKPLYIRQGLFEFNPSRHDFGEKHFLGHVIKGTGFAEVEQALDILARSPITARHVSTQIATYFLGDTPPDELVDHMSRSFVKADGDIATVLRTMADDPLFVSSLNKSFKDPVHYVVSAVRFAYGDQPLVNTQPLIGWIRLMGQGLYDRRTPDGYDMHARAWMGPGQISMRLKIAQRLSRASSDLLMGTPHDTGANIQAIVQKSRLEAGLSASTKAGLAQASNAEEWGALFLSSPEFMHR